MPIEVERKFLVDPSKLPQPLVPERTFQLVQGYLADDPWVRVRLIGSTGARLTIKGTGNISRSEFEYDIPRDDAEELLKMCKGLIRKTRHEVIFEGHKWELDLFQDALKGLCLAEIELKAEDEAFALPPWVAKEVSNCPEYSNAQLSSTTSASVIRFLIKGI